MSIYYFRLPWAIVRPTVSPQIIRCHNYLSPESWVKDQDPCDIHYHEGRITDSFADMVLPTLSKTKYESLNLKAGGQFMSRTDFDAIREDCLSLFQRKKFLRNANFLDHLMNYDPPEGLRLATAEMMIQGFNNGGDILRMANNIIKLKQAQVKLNNSPAYQATNRELQIYTMSLDDFISQPTISALNFFNFVLDSSPVPQSRKEDVAYKYWQHYATKMDSGNPNIRNHITHNKKSSDKEYLMEYLRQDSVFGPSLSRIELLVEAALMTQ
jgi:hypothetical protein